MFMLGDLKQNKAIEKMYGNPRDAGVFRGCGPEIHKKRQSRS